MILLVSKILLVCVALFQFHRATRKGNPSAFHYWYIGTCGYNLAASFVSGMLWDGVETLYYVCIAGVAVSFVLEFAKKRRAVKKTQSELQSQFTKNLEEAQEIMNYYESQQTMEITYAQH